jgi:hypothetical protein
MDISSSPSHIVPGSTQVYCSLLDRVIEHDVCYVDRKAGNNPFPKCTTGVLPGHQIEQCHPRINFCISQAMVQQHTDVFTLIRKACNQFHPVNQARKPNVPSVKQLIAALDLKIKAEDIDT